MDTFNVLLTTCIGTLITLLCIFVTLAGYKMTNLKADGSGTSTQTYPNNQMQQDVVVITNLPSSEEDDDTGGLYYNGDSESLGTVLQDSGQSGW